MDIKSKLSHYYRFALIGATSSGKTCMLAKLASNNDSNTRFGSGSVPLGDFAPIDKEYTDPSKWSEDRKLQENFRIGSERLEAAIAKFSMLQRPDATSNDGARPMMRFKLSDCEQRGDFYVWTEDYAGELLNKEGLTDPDSQSSRLKNNLLEYDGLVIIVEASEKPDEMETARRQIETLNQFFTALAEEEKREGRENNIPVAVVVTKWDRISKEIQFQNPGAERALLEKYIEKNSLYQTIVTAVSSNARDLPVEENANCQTAIIRGNTAIFPVSAFGKSKLDEKGHDFPLESSSFCLVEPFFWLASKCDEIRVSELEKSLNKQSLINPGLRTTYPKIKVLNQFMGPSNACYERFSNAKHSFFTKLLKFFCFWVFFTLISAYTCTCLYWGHQFRKWETAMKQTENTLQDYDNLKTLFVNYKKGHLCGKLFFPGKKRTDAAIQFIETAADKQIWHITGDLAQDAKMALAYIEKYPNGAHAEEAHKIVQDYAISNEKFAWEAVQKYPILRDQAVAAQKYLEDFDQDGKATYRHEAQAIIAQYRIQHEEDDWELVLNAKPESDDQKKLAEQYLAVFNQNGQARHGTDAQKIITAAENRAVWDSDVAAYNQECIGNDSEKIITRLCDLYVKHSDRCKPLIEALPKLILDKVNEKRRAADLSTMITEYGKIASAIKGLEETFRDHNEMTLADNVLAQLKHQLDTQKEESINKYDEKLYQDVRLSRSSNKCQRYLDEMDKLRDNGGSMKSSVQAYKQYLADENDKFSSVSINAKVRWNHGVYNSIHHERVKIGNTVFIDRKCDPPKGGNENDIGSHQFYNISLTDSFPIEVYFVTVGNWYNNNNKVWANETRNYTLKQLKEGKEIDINFENKAFGTIVLKATIPNHIEPELPPWHK